MNYKKKIQLSKEGSLSDDCKYRTYLSTTEAAVYLRCDVKKVRQMVRNGSIQSVKTESGQYRVSLEELKNLENSPEFCCSPRLLTENNGDMLPPSVFEINGTSQTVYCRDSRDLSCIGDCSVHLVITSPPYFNAKMYSEEIDGDLGNIHTMEEWLSEIAKVWAEVFRVLQPGRKAFVNIMNLPVKHGKSYRALNLVGGTIDLMEKTGFIFKRDIIWHKTNGVKAPFGTYPYPGGILINNMHEFILEFEKPAPDFYRKYTHLTDEQKMYSLIDKEFWLSLKNSDVWLIQPEKSGDCREHIAPFPVELPHRIIKAYSYFGETVLDPFGGSLVTLQAASQLGRNGVAVEVNPDIVKKAAGKFM
ncbi:MAG: excisionase family DNA-binding protein [Firmicutes bacterium]|nr:excisionase family DNA-binding protein [Bacillota bacterium]